MLDFVEGFFFRRFCFCCCMAWSTIQKRSHWPAWMFGFFPILFSLHFNQWSIDETKLKVLGFCFFIHILPHFLRREKMRPDPSLLLTLRTSRDFNHLGCIESDIQNPGISYQPQLIITKFLNYQKYHHHHQSSSSSSSSSSSWSKLSIFPVWLWVLT